MHPDELNKPLGLDADTQPHRREIPWAAIAFAGLAVLGVGVFAFARLTAPVAPDIAATLSSIGPARSPEKPPGAPVEAQRSADDLTASIPAQPRAHAREVEEASGVRGVRQGGAAPPAALIITVPTDNSERRGEKP